MKLNKKGVNVYHVRRQALVVSFDLSHFKYGAAVLKWLGKVFKTDSFAQIERDVEEDMRPALPHELRYHICCNCFMEVDTRSGNALFVDNTWFHNRCPELKEGRPV